MFTIQSIFNDDEEKIRLEKRKFSPKGILSVIRWRDRIQHSIAVTEHRISIQVPMKTNRKPNSTCWTRLSNAFIPPTIPNQVRLLLLLLSIDRFDLDFEATTEELDDRLPSVAHPGTSIGGEPIDEASDLDQFRQKLLKYCQRLISFDRTMVSLDPPMTKNYRCSKIID